jgi:hypothetical protein
MSKIFWNSLTAEIIKLFSKAEEPLEETKSLEKEKMEDTFYEGCKTGNLEMVNTCIAYGIDPSGYTNVAFRIAVYKGYISVVDRLLQDKRVDPRVNDYSALYSASQEGHLEILDLLFQDKRFTPTHAMKKYAILLVTNGIDPYCNTNIAFRIAVDKGYILVMDRLLQDKRVDPKVKDFTSLNSASQEGQLDILDLLLQDEQFTPTRAMLRYAILLETNDGRTKMLGRLVQAHNKLPRQ